MAEQSIQEAALEVRTLKEQYREAKGQYEALKDQHDQAQATLIERMDNEKVEGIKADGSNFVPTKTIYGRVDDRKAFVEWAKLEAPELLEDRERKELINEAARQLLDDGEVFPPGLSFYTKESISIRAAKKS